MLCDVVESIFNEGNMILYIYIHSAKAKKSQKSRFSWQSINFWLSRKTTFLLTNVSQKKPWSLPAIYLPSGFINRGDRKSSINARHWFLPSGYLTQPWKIAHLQMVYLLKMVIFHGKLLVITRWHIPQKFSRRQTLKTSPSVSGKKMSVNCRDFPAGIGAKRNLATRSTSAEAHFSWYL